VKVAGAEPIIRGVRLNGHGRIRGGPVGTAATRRRGAVLRTGAGVAPAAARNGLGDAGGVDRRTPTMGRAMTATRAER